MFFEIVIKPAVHGEDERIQQLGSALEELCQFSSNTQQHMMLSQLVRLGSSQSLSVVLPFYRPSTTIEYRPEGWLFPTGCQSFTWGEAKDWIENSIPADLVKEVIVRPITLPDAKQHRQHAQEDKND